MTILNHFAKHKYSMNRWMDELTDYFLFSTPDPFFVLVYPVSAQEVDLYGLYYPGFIATWHLVGFI